MSWASLSLAAACVFGLQTDGAPLSGALDAAAAESGADASDWPSYGRDAAEQRFSPLTQIDRASVSRLGLAWSYDLADPGIVESTPIVVGRTLYATGPWSKVYAMDAATGRPLWTYDPAVDKATAIKACCNAVNRGVAYADGKVFVGALDGRLIALDARTGAVAWSVHTTDPAQSYTITGAPRVVKGKVIIGNGGAEYGVRGYVSAYDEATGKLVWRFYTVPGDPAKGFENDAMRMAAKTWTGQWWRYGGGGTAWDSIVYDPELDLLYVGAGNGSPWNAHIRSPGGGDNLFLASIIALRPDTGDYVWHYQVNPGESWDFTATQPMILADLTLDGQARKVLMQAPKNGFFYVLDRTNGKLISAKPFAAVNWATGIDLKTGRPIERPEARFPNGMAVRLQPGAAGAHSWQPMSYSPQTGLAYLPVNNWSWLYRDDPGFKFNPKFWNLGTLDEGATRTVRNTMAKLPIASGGYLLAWNPATQTAAWRAPLDGGGGTLATAGGLVLAGDGGGRLAAYDAASGKVLWTAPLQNNAAAGPIAYEIDGQEYVAVAVGRGNFFLADGYVANPAVLPNTNRVLAFKLGGAAVLPPLNMPAMAARLPKLPPVTATAATVAHGRDAFHHFCYGCHGENAAGDSSVQHPDLRYAPELARPGVWRAIVMNGALAHGGMVSFQDAFDARTAEAIRQYVISQSRAAARRQPFARSAPIQ